MSFKPDVIAFDVETENPEGSALNYWEPSFRVKSAAFAWFGPDGEVRTRYLEGEDGIRAQVSIVLDQGIALVAHNASFELGCLVYRLGLPDVSTLRDTMRLAQCFDNGGREGLRDGPLSLEDEIAMLEGDLKVKTGLGLESAVSRILPKQFHDHKAPYYAWLRENGVKKGQEGANLHRLPPEMLEAYNVADAVVTLMLYKTLTERFAEMGYDWAFDHRLHMSACRRIVEAKARGVMVDRDKLRENRDKVDEEAGSIEVAFYRHHKDIIQQMEADRFAVWKNEPKTERGKAQRAVKDIPEGVRFNPRSTAQLKELFVDRLGVQPVFWTKESKASKNKRNANPDLAPYVPNPSFRAAHLPSYGEGGEMLASYKKRLLVMKQMERLLELSGRDGRFHHNINACGTKTGRYTSTGGLNIQAIARKEQGLVGCLLADEGRTLVSMDLGAGEPTTSAHYTQDKNYRALVFDMEGQAPRWDGDLLLLNDPYLAFASISPLGQKAVRDAWEQGLFNDWVKDADSVRSKLKKIRGIHKTLFLGLNYGLGARGLVSNAADQGVAVSFQQAKEIHNRYWNHLFPGIRSFSERLQIQFKRQGWLTNEMGYRLVPEHERLVYNHFIQSTVSGLMKLYEEFLLSEAPYARYILTWHDETIVDVPDGRVDDFRQAAQRATKQLNEYVNWSVEIKTGFAQGKTFYEAK